MASNVEVSASLEPVGARARSAPNEATRQYQANGAAILAVCSGAYGAQILQRDQLSHRISAVAPPVPSASTATVQANSDPYDPFFIPLPILFETPVSPQPGSALLQLPDEILTLIMQQVKIPYFQVCFALTCKAMGRIASMKNLLSPWRGYRDKDGLFRLLERKHYIPQQLRLCRACFLFLPRDRGHWTRILAEPEFDNKYANWCDILNWFDPKSYSQHRCPRCCIRVYTSYMSEECYETDTGDKGVSNGKRICPELVRRMNKP
ncbi:hypothetical protein A1O3_07718 [Capronia epimyces CBS 606.96]|uniref:F-box domain-containing protein n=1 Tax=Capronia epimyces CBS 606.96 TaxID=1182542 RepID=W9XWS5_9EURO|nr:uncharacterized protein A1O3_07718 [Capronia epimyces CBS 606.96]EXJ81426.1 hypothetical protein A1O3_07718 [Capronia epimyces CBS 606.96]